MKEVSSKDLILAIELKEEGIEKETLEIIKKYYNKANVFITSFIYNALLNVRKLDKTIKIGWLIKEDINQKNILEFMKISGNQICPPADLVSENNIKERSANKSAFYCNFALSKVIKLENNKNKKYNGI